LIGGGQTPTAVRHVDRPPARAPRVSIISLLYSLLLASRLTSQFVGVINKLHYFVITRIIYFPVKRPQHRASHVTPAPSAVYPACKSRSRSRPLFFFFFFLPLFFYRLFSVSSLAPLPDESRGFLYTHFA